MIHFTIEVDDCLAGAAPIRLQQQFTNLDVERQSQQNSGFAGRLLKPMGVEELATFENPKEAPSLCPYAPIADYNLPAEPVKYAAKKTLLTLRQFMRLDKLDAASSLKTVRDKASLTSLGVEFVALSAVLEMRSLEATY